MKNLYTDAIQDKTFKQKQVIASTLIEFQDVFSKSDTDLGLTHLAEHEIDTGNAKPIKQQFRRVPLAFQKDEKEAIDKLLDQGVIRPSSS